MGNQDGEFGLPYHSLSNIFGKVQCQRGPVVVSLCQALLLAAVHPSSQRPAHVTCRRWGPPRYQQSKVRQEAAERGAEHDGLLPFIGP